MILFMKIFIFSEKIFIFYVKILDFRYEKSQ